MVSALARPSGAYAMLAVDQREGLRAMMAQHQPAPVTNAALTEFKLQAIRALTPHASAVLIDRELAWEQAIEQRAVAPGCGLIAAADVLISSADELVADVEIDGDVDPARVKAQGAVAMKLLVLWRPGDPAAPRIAMVDAFIARCRAGGLLAIVEPVVRRPRDGSGWDREGSILAAAKELGTRGQDIYKGEVPLFGTGVEAEIRAAYAAVHRAVTGPWVVLSSGVPQDAFPQAVKWACREGASGFLAGRGIWSGTIGAPDVALAMNTDAAPRLQRLCDVVDRAVTA